MKKKSVETRQKYEGKKFWFSFDPIGFLCGMEISKGKNEVVAGFISGALERATGQSGYDTFKISMDILPKG